MLSLNFSIRPLTVKVLESLVTLILFALANSSEYLIVTVILSPLDVPENHSQYKCC